MQAIFTPAISIMNRLRFTQKYAFIGIFGMIAITVLINNLYSALSANITASRAELQGIQAVRPTHKLVQALQQHRGMSAGVLAGNETMKDKRAAKEKEVDGSFKTVSEQLPAELVSGKTWQEISAEWQRIRNEGLGWAGAENFTRHTALIDHLLIFMVDMADAYSLSLDPEVDSYYLMDTVINKAPVALERLGQMRARGTVILTKKEMRDQQKIEMSSLMAELNSALRTLKINLEKTARFNPGMATALHTASSEFSASAEQINSLITEDMIGGKFSTVPKDYFDLTTTAINKGYTQMFDTMLPTLEQLIQRRITQLQRDLSISIGVSLLMILIVGYFAMGTYFATANSVRQLAETAHTLSTGDLRPRIDLGTKDELKLVGDSFNNMADAFSALLRNVQSSAHQVLAASVRMASASIQITRSAETQSESAGSMAAAIEQMTVGIDHIAQNAAHANDISHQAGALSAEGGRIVGTVVTEIQKIANAVNDSASIIQKLGNHSDAISAIVNVIKDIADQTNLLALNAAIEAARAGESGRGFAVVADEVRKLAERTAKSTQEISAMIGAIQGGTQDAVTAMHNGVERVNQGVALATRAGAAMGEIQSNADQVVATVADISSSLREQSAASTEIARNVEQIAQLAEQNNAAVTDSAATARELERLAKGLETEIQHFRVA